MILKQSIEISCPREKVWRFIEDPEGMKAWNPKIQAIEQISWGERTLVTGIALRM
jgi:carbon monoxide dehydrogenase subunit G